MNRSFFRRALTGASALGIIAGSLVSGAAPAHAVLPSGEVAVAAGGSDTTEKAMNQIMASPLVNGRTVTINTGTVTARTYNIPSFSSTPFVVPGDASGAVNCSNDVTWSKDPLAPASNSTPTVGIEPFGSGAGRNLLSVKSGTATDAGCMDVARSSASPRSASAAGTTDKSTFEYYAFAMDAVAWGTTSMKAPATLTRQQITDIYNCNVTDWGAVGGQPGPIQRYFPQKGSGTRAFFQSDILIGGIDPANFTNASCPAVILLEENQFNSNNTYSGGGFNPSDTDKSIVPYSAALWDYQAAQLGNPTIDFRNGVRLGGITTAASTPLTSSPVFWSANDFAYELSSVSAENPNGVVKESNIKQFNPSFSGGTNVGEFPGIRYVYNVIDRAQTLPGYQVAKQLLGFTNSTGGAKGPLCDNATGGAGSALRGMITSNGFASLPATTFTPSNLAGSTCRFFPPNP